MLPSSIQNFIAAFSRLPAIGPRAATRLAFHILGLDAQTQHALESTLQGLAHLDECPHCFFVKQKDKDRCVICSDKSRDHTTIAIVEKPTDLLTIEKSGAYRGIYCVIGEISARGTLESAHSTRLKSLKARIEKKLGGAAQEIVIATNPNIIGDLLYNTVVKDFKDHARRITRLGRGIPTGGEVEFADRETLRDALERRI